MAKPRQSFLMTLGAVALAAFLVLALASLAAAATDVPPKLLTPSLPWWAWVLLMFVLSFILGVVSLLGGMGGGTLFVAIVGGWANTTILNLLMGAPLKVAVGTSKLIVALTDTSAAWIYLHRGAILPIVVVPSILGMMLGSWAGVSILVRIAPIRLRYIVISLLLFAGVRSLLKGLGVWP